MALFSPFSTLPTNRPLDPNAPGPDSSKFATQGTQPVLNVPKAGSASIPVPAAGPVGQPMTPQMAEALRQQVLGNEWVKIQQQQAAQNQAIIDSLRAPEGQLNTQPFNLAIQDLLKQSRQEQAATTSKFSPLIDKLLKERGIQVEGPAESQVTPAQMELIQQLQAQSRGETPSIAEAQMRAAQDRNVRNQMALAASLSGRAAPLAQRQVMQQQALGGQEIAQAAGIARLQEQMAAQQQLAAAAQAARQAELQQAQIAQDAARANQAAELQRLGQAGDLTSQRAGIEAQLQQARLGTGAEAAQAELGARTQEELQRMRGATDIEVAKVTGREDRRAAREASERAMAGNILSALGTGIL